MISLKLRFITGIVGLAVCSSIAGPGAAFIRADAVAAIQESADGARRIKPEDARELLNKSKAVLVDVRGEASYKAGHIKDALNIPFSDIRARAKELPADKMIITYCS
ncbi:MAG: ArsR family transcriptional regulator [Acidobacteria bacterium]|nr:ArsR family transcriptional regulator [Acidobacteriota bacterium]